jgi:2-polyprenyl-3-methyl-5-hydroxy-6-metoxy-1,4-benzoquinol methylase
VRYVERISFVADYVRGKRVLDCGVIGSTEEEAAERIRLMPQGLHWRLREVAEVTGIDLDPELVDEARRAYPELHLIAASIETMDVGRFDVVVIGDLLEHLSNPGLALDRARASLVPGGEIIVTCPNAFGLPNYLRFLFGRFREGGDHVLSFNVWTLTQLLARHGFRAVATHTCLDHKPKRVGRRILYTVPSVVLRAAPRLGGTLLVIARAD